jgi:hypothetical protein
MDSEAIRQTETDDDILSLDVSDDALERASTAEQKAFTLVYCTNPWYNCGLPQQCPTIPTACRYLPRSAAPYRRCLAPNNR